MSAADTGEAGTAIRAATAVPKPIGAGPEMAALGRFYQDVTWKGTIHEGGMGSGTPAMTGVGHATARQQRSVSTVRRHLMRSGQTLGTSLPCDHDLPSGGAVFEVPNSR